MSDWWNWAYFCANFRKFWKYDPCLYQFLHWIRGHLYTRRLILRPISAARPRIDLCTKNPPPPGPWPWGFDHVLIQALHHMHSHKLLEPLGRMRTGGILIRDTARHTAYSLWFNEAQGHTSLNHNEICCIPYENASRTGLGILPINMIETPNSMTE